ncbi:MAG: ATP phosphoribosyltransferase regulatory subunit, partial [Myxococcota bacterium]
MSALPLTAPKGLRDLLPDATARLSAIQARVAHGFAQAGYQRVTTPAFEYADVLERGLEIDRRDLVRFVEPDSGEVALLRPDMTPQVARIAATRLAHLPPPLRLSYCGTVIRRREGRARRSRMSSHAGVECIGRAAPQGDEEVLRLACETLVALGLPRWHLELGQVSVAGAVLERVPKALRARAKAALSRKDAVAIDALGSAIAPDLRILAELYGDASVIDDARRLLASSKYPELNAALDELETMVPIAEGAIADLPDATLGID